MKKCLPLILLLGLLLVSCGGKDVRNFHTDDQQSYLDGDYRNYAKYANGKEEKSIPLPITLEAGNEKEITLSMDKDFKDSKTYAVNDGVAKVYNLFSGTTYYYKVGNKTKSFVTSSGVRNLYIDGVTNVRDIGSYTKEDGKPLKQGLLYRTSKFNNDESTDLMITKKGLNTVRELGIKSELDLRKVEDNENGGITVSPLGSNVNYYSIPMLSSGNIMTLNKDIMDDIFAILGNKDNYPLAFHCSIGTDRTGYIAFLVEALCGVNEDTLYRDYLFSNFGLIGGLRTYNTIERYLDTINGVEGTNLSEKTYNYLKDSGVSTTDLDNVRTILTNK